MTSHESPAPFQWEYYHICPLKYTHVILQLVVNNELRYSSWVLQDCMLKSLSLHNTSPSTYGTTLS